MISELSSQPITNNNNIIYNNSLRNHEINNREVGGISVRVLDGDIDEDTHTQLMSEFTPENVNSVISEAPACDHAMISETPILISEAPACDHAMISEESLSEDSKFYLLPLLRQALVKLAKEEYHSTVLDLDEFVREFNSRTPDYKKSLGLVAVGNEARKMKIRGWRL